MSILKFHASLESESFPFLGSRMPRTTLLKDGQDSGRLMGGDGTDIKAPTVPQCIYVENCVPTVGGFQSVGYNSIVPAIPGVNNITGRIEIKSSNGGRYQLAVTADDKAYLLDMSGSSVWTLVTLPFSTGIGSAMITTAFAQGETYIHFANLGMVKLDYSTVTTFPFAFSAVTLAGINTAKILGCCGSTNYLLIYDTVTIYWSSVLSPLDFVPSLTTGADSTSVSDAKGLIQFIAPIPQGFMVYTSANVVSATYTANMRYPWNFREVPGSAGVHDPEQVSFDENFSEQMAWSNSGLMKLNRIEATVMFPELTDFITCRRFEAFDWTNGVNVITMLSSSLKCKVTIVSSRYLLVSYGINSLTNVLVYDYALKRWGALKIDHVDVFEYITSSWTGARIYSQMRGAVYSGYRNLTYTAFRKLERPVGTPKHSICFVGTDGSVKLLSMDLSDNTRSGMILLGRYQYIRSRWLKVLGYDISNVDAAVTNYESKIFTSYDGNNISAQLTPYVASPAAEGIRNHLCTVTGINHIIGIKGAFDLTTIQIAATLSGRN